MFDKIDKMIKIDLSKEKDSQIKYDAEKKTLTIDISNEPKYTVYLYEIGKENEVYTEIMNESELIDLEHRIAFNCTNKRIHSKERFIE